MYKLSNEFIEALQNGTHRNLKVVFSDGTEVENENIWSESLEISNTLTDSEQIGFGKCNASTMNITIAGVDKTCIGKKVYLRMFLTGFTESLPLGVYTVDSAQRQENKSFRKITAYDNMRLLQTDVSAWYNGLELDKNEITQSQMLKSLLNYCGIPFINAEINSLVNGAIRVEETIKPSKMQGLLVAEAILEINGVFGRIDNLGVFRVVNPNIKSAIKEIGKSQYDYTKLNYEEYTTKPINALQIRMEEGDIGYVIHADEDENGYIVTNNFLIYGKSAEEMKIIGDNLFNVINGFSYRPFEIGVYNMPEMELGDWVSIPVGEDVIESPILIHSLNGIQAFSETFESVGSEYLNFEIIGENLSIEQLRGKMNILERTVEGTTSKVVNLEVEINGEKGIATIVQQLSGQIITEVTVGGETVSRFSQELGRFLFEGDTFEIQTDNITIQGDVLEINNGYIGNLRIGSEGLSSDDYTTLQIFKDGTGKFTNLSGNGKGQITLKPRKSEDDEDIIVPFVKTIDGFHADYDTKSSKSTVMYTDEDGVAHYGLISGNVEDSNKRADMEIVLTSTEARVQKGDGTLMPILASNIGQGGETVYGNFSANDNFSLQEKVVGKWINDKPLYRKTVEIDNKNRTATDYQYSIQLVSDNIEEVVQVDAHLHYMWGHLELNGSYNNNAYYFRGSNYMWQWTIPTNSWDSNSGKIIATYWYTKTTDIPVTELPDPLYVKYDDSERVIGEWFGEPLYQKTIITKTCNSKNWTTIAPYDVNIKKVISIRGWFQNGNGDFNMIPHSEGGYCISVIYNYGGVMMKMDNPTSVFSEKDCYITLQYTKG